MISSQVLLHYYYEILYITLGGQKENLKEVPKIDPRIIGKSELPMCES